MKILSWDVGITNLAYCLIDDGKIERWGIIDLVDDRITCQCELRTKRVCGDIAKYSLVDASGVMRNMCSKHKTNFIPKIIPSHKSNTKQKITPENVEMVSCDVCKMQRSKQTEDGIHGWCDKHFDKYHKVYLNKFKPKRMASQKCSIQSLTKLTTKMYEKFDEITDFLKVDDVVIENQPALTNPTMKSISCAIFSYFVMRGLYEKKNNSTIKDVKFVSANNKLKVHDNLTTEMLKGIKDKRGKYEITKALGELYCNAMADNTALKILKTYSKQDDMCDAYLQGFRYMFPTTPDNYMKLLNGVDKSGIVKIRERYLKKQEERVDIKDIDEVDEVEEVDENII